jgi:hypothetical protein
VRWNPYRTDVEIDVLHVPDCPHVQIVRDRLAEAAAIAQVCPVVRERLIHDRDEAESAGMRGSPTICVDGRPLDVAETDEASMSCRLVLPTVGQLAEALAR